MTQHAPHGRGPRSAVFAPLGTAARSAQVAQRLTDAILLGVLKPGERLPTEAELAKRFGVALVTAREALSEIREAGLVETRRGRDGGSFVLASTDAPEQVIMTRLRSISRIELADVGTYEATLCAGAAERAAELASPEEATRLAAWWEGADFSSAQSAARNQGGLLLEISVASQSPRLVREQIRFQAEFGQLLWLGLGEGGIREQVSALNSEIVQAIGSGDAGHARAVVRAELKLLTTWLLKTKERLEAAA
ncbi:FadR/GntR family transcriptional regulator [Paeniglutamicibacter sp. NPDC091659]|uniref:FadR/GntR family transcriptional regulator n=1 Tax=Paeniglutamicibacter sp. NPDC091659 TaxID=3364389 RepID=UPI0038117901